MQNKIINDAAAYIRGLAQLRGRNEEWAEEAVRSGSSLSAEEAINNNVIDLIANSIHDLLSKLDNYSVKILGEERKLVTRNSINKLF